MLCLGHFFFSLERRFLRQIGLAVWGYPAPCRKSLIWPSERSRCQRRRRHRPNKDSVFTRHIRHERPNNQTRTGTRYVPEMLDDVFRKDTMSKASSMSSHRRMSFHPLDVRFDVLVLDKHKYLYIYLNSTNSSYPLHVIIVSFLGSFKACSHTTRPHRHFCTCARYGVPRGTLRHAHCQSHNAGHKIQLASSTRGFQSAHSPACSLLYNRSRACEQKAS